VIAPRTTLTSVAKRASLRADQLTRLPTRPPSVCPSPAPALGLGPNAQAHLSLYRLPQAGHARSTQPASRSTRLSPTALLPPVPFESAPAPVTVHSRGHSPGPERVFPQTQFTYTPIANLRCGEPEERSTRPFAWHSSRGIFFFNSRKNLVSPVLPARVQVSIRPRRRGSGWVGACAQEAIGEHMGERAGPRPGDPPPPAQLLARLLWGDPALKGRGPGQ